MEIKLEVNFYSSTDPISGSVLFFKTQKIGLDYNFTVGRSLPEQGSGFFKQNCAMILTYTTTEAAKELPLHPDDVRFQLGLKKTDQYLNDCIRYATELLEFELNRCLMRQKIEVKFESWSLPSDRFSRRHFPLHCMPIQEVIRFAFHSDKPKKWYSIAPEKLWVDTVGEVAKLYGPFPTNMQQQLSEQGGVIELWAGWGSRQDLPPRLKKALLCMIDDWETKKPENRKYLPYTAIELTRSYRILK